MKISNDTKRTIAFFAGCLTSRILFALYAMKYPQYLPQMAMIALIPVIGWWRIMNGHPRNKGMETFGGNIWWQNLRPIHMFNYILFIIMAIQKKPYAYKILVLDVIIAFFAEINYRFMKC